MSNQSSPLTFEIDPEIFADLESFRQETGTRSASVIIRKALEDFDLNSVQSDQNPAKQMSVRLPLTLCDELRRASKSNGVSIGKIAREALIEFFENNDPSESGPILERKAKTDPLSRPKSTEAPTKASTKENKPVPVEQRTFHFSGLEL